MERQPSRQRTDLGRASGDHPRNGPLGTWREHCRLFHGSNRTKGGNVSMGRRKAELARRRIDRGELVSDRSLHADGLAQHTRGRLWDRAPWCWWSYLEHSGVPIQPAGQLHWASTVLEEPQAPGYGTQNCGMATNSVNDYLVCRYLQSGNWVGQLAYQESFVPVTVSTYPTITMCQDH
jgi:hypothetical protein